MLWEFSIGFTKEIDLKYHSKITIILGKYNIVAFLFSFLEHMLIEWCLHEGLLA